MLGRMQKKETLQEYVTRIVVEKGEPGKPLSAATIERNARGAITASYVNKILAGSAKNPSAAKLRALAIGLGVDVNELLSAAHGHGPEENDKLRSRVSALMSRAQELESEEDLSWFEDMMSMVDRELDRRLTRRKKK